MIYNFRFRGLAYYIGFREVERECELEFEWKSE